MAFESNLMHLGEMTLSTAYDARRSTITGTTLNGPNGSAQFAPVSLSTTNDYQVNLSTGFTPSTFAQVIGILQNTPGPGEAADIGFFGVSKMIAGSTFARGTLLQPSSTSGLYVVPWLTGNGPPVGIALETPSAAGNVFTGLLFGFGHGGYST